MIMAAQGSILGNAVTRKEDPGLLTGANAYVDDLDIQNVDSRQSQIWIRDSAWGSTVEN